MANMHMQLRKLWQNVEAMGANHGYEKEQFIWHRELCNNSMWFQKTNLIEVLGLMGAGFRMGAMLSRDT
jgi:tyrosyl-tRNA synthetase